MDDKIMTLENNRLRLVYERNDECVQYLIKSDNRLGCLIKYIRKVELVLEPNGFKCLVKYIIGQQISDKARETIWNRLQMRFKDITPQNFITIDAEDICNVGLSRRKALCIKSLSKKIDEGYIDLENLKKESNKAVISILTEVKGIGKWTAEMYLIFSLGRIDVLSKSDGTIKRVLQWMYNLTDVPSSQDVENYFQKWSGFETIVSAFLWSSIGLNLIHTPFSKIIEKELTENEY